MYTYQRITLKKLILQNVVQSDKSYLIYWKQTTSDDNDAIFSALTGQKGETGPPGAVGKAGSSGEDATFYAQYFQHSKTKWDIDFNPRFWMNGYDIQNTPFKVLNK